VQSLLPDGATVMTTGSSTLDEIGFTGLLKAGQHAWMNLKDRILAEKDPVRQDAVRRSATQSKYFLGSVHAVTEKGQLVVGSGTGSQIAAYSYEADNVILFVGAQKVTSDLGEAMARLRSHSYALEDARMKALGYPGANLPKILIWENERKRSVNVILVNEKLGF